VAQAGVRSGIRNPNPKYQHLTCHLFRHSFARVWKARGGSIESLSKILGHESVRTTWDEYGSESLEDVRRNYAKIMEGKSSRAGQGTSPTTWRRTR
jgi:integrase